MREMRNAYKIVVGKHEVNIWEIHSKEEKAKQLPSETCRPETTA
jgi:hypothetical protein